MSGLNDLAIFILTYGRPDEIITLKTLKRAGINKNVFLVISDDDKELAKYQEQYGDMVKVFHREDINEDMMDNKPQKSGIISARNVCFELSKKLGYKYFLELDDDYISFEFRMVKDSKLKGYKIKNLSPLLKASIDFMESSKIDCFAWAQGGDLIGGAQSNVVKKGWKRKAMNFIFFKSTSEIRFSGRINEDVNMYVHNGKQGKLILTNSLVSLNQKQTQTNKKGMTDLYNENGTYLKSMYSVIKEPAIVSLGGMGNVHLRIHHNVNWNACTPKVLNARYKKGD